MKSLSSLAILAALASFGQTPTTPYAAWELDDGSGTAAADSSGNKLTASLYNGPAWLPATQCIAAGCLSFNGANQYGSVALNLSDTTAVTVSFWMKWNAYANDDKLALEFGSGAAGYNNRATGFMINPNSSYYGGTMFEVSLKGDVWYNQVLFSRPSAGVWHHYAFVFNKANPAATEIIPYVDGVAVAYTKPTSGENSNAFGADTLYLMSRNGTSIFGAGALDDVRIYKRPLLPSEIAALSLQPIAVFGTGVTTAGVLLAGASTDGHYRLVSSPDTSFPGPNAIVVNSVPPWLPDGPNSKWIAPRASLMTGNTPGVYTYRTTFDLTGFNSLTAVLTGRWAADDSAVMKLNGAVVSTVPTFASWTSFTVSTGFVAGVNTLDFVVTNAGSSANPTGLRVDLSGQAATAAPSTIAVSVSPAAVSLQPSQNQTFTATVIGTSNIGVTWSFSPPLGSLASTATTTVYVAPSTAPTTQSVMLTATSIADPSKTATAVITLLQAVTVSLGPSTVSLGPSGTQQFTATVLGASNTAVTWSINASVGTISSAGLYRAPSSIATPQTATVTAQSLADPTKSASAQVFLSTPEPSFTYYVDSTNGSDANPGTQAAPWKTIAKVNSTTLTPSQSVGFARGGVWRGTLTPRQSGTAGSPITFGAYGSGAQPIIRGDSPLTSWTTEGSIFYAPASWKPTQVWYNGSRLNLVATKVGLVTGSWWWDSTNLRVYIFDTPASQTVSASLADAVIVAYNYTTIRELNLEYSNYGISANTVGLTGLLVSGNTVQHNGRIGVYIGGGTSTTTFATNLTVDSNTVQDNGGHGIGFVGRVSSVVISNNIVTGNGILPDLPNWGWHGISVWAPASNQSADGVLITGNTVSQQYANNSGAGTVEGTGIQADGWVNNATISHNTVHDNQGFGIVSNCSSNIDILYNLVYNNGTSRQANNAGGIAIASSVPGSGCVNNRILYNTIYGSYQRGIAVSGTGTSGLIIENNILMDNGETEIWTWDVTTFTSDYNCIYHTAGGNFMTLINYRYSWANWKTNTGTDANSKNQNPSFTSASAGDFTLQPGSPAIGATIYIPGVTMSNPSNIGAK